MRGPTQTRYANSDGVHIAYQVIGDGPVDLIFVPGWVSHVEHHWEEPRLAYFLHRLARISRLIILDKRGTGLSDRTAQQHDLEQRMDDVRAVQDAVGSKQAVLFGYSEGGSMCLLFAATYPQRALALITYGSWAKRLRSTDYPWGPTLEERQRFLDFIVSNWGGIVDLEDLAPSAARDPDFCEWFASYLRRSASPGAALALAQMNTYIDLRPVLPTIHVPTLIIHRTGDKDAPVEGGRYLAQRIPDAQFVELAGGDHLPWVGDSESVLASIESFLLNLRLLAPTSQFLASVLALRWNDASPREQGASDPSTDFRSAVAEALIPYDGTLVPADKGSSIVAILGGPLRALRCARDLSALAQRFALDVGVGVHIGRCDFHAQTWSGESLDLARELAAAAAPGQIAVSREVKDLAPGSGFTFVDPPPRRTRRHVALDLFILELDAAEAALPMRPAQRPPDRVRPAASHSPLTRQQQLILGLVAQGKSNKEIARLTGRSEHTVHRHMANIFNRLGVFSRAAAVATGAYTVAPRDGPNGR